MLGRRQPQTVATLLVLERHRSVSRSEVADALWDGDLPPHWAGAVRGVISKVRAFLDEAGVAEWLQTGTDGWRLALPADVDVDVEACEAVVAAAEENLRRRRDLAGKPAVEAETDLLGALAEVDSVLAAGVAPGARSSTLVSWWRAPTGPRSPSTTS